MNGPRRILAVLGVAAAIGIFAWKVVAAADRIDPCGAGFVHQEARCLASPPCPPPLVETPAGCDAAEHDVVEVPAARLVVGPSDWEAEGKVRPRTIVTAAFAIDRVEVTVGLARRLAPELAARGRLAASDAARALGAVTLDEARAFCTRRGGRLPTEEEWTVAAAGPRGSRYPWGDTGAVCRRAAWGLLGTCARSADGPDTVGAHPDGRTPSGIHDLAGNVAEWVEGEARPGFGVAKGGSWASGLATELRTWGRREMPLRDLDGTVGFRCAYDRGVGSELGPGDGGS